ncbi:MAG: bifunctional cobalt-precorrin-7 (C(5))-methyltransferase/cobalt-precorrin-6B (C(15))-methyltransferase [Deltaproteobacteria bacterium HGW-Deltaproteobacteria-15]|jgi:precorrin-6Y C5,15-methyltransferase (decarboxylating)|nr:MAG: bifunctional cobalt-precorrin-7 (C(5))-methyltransferase/cobalt-precorrin-6B (C(15))-methyltransferase [Deltaproteobacteria bacterium HGW-Deltaproteobacteria-15]
MHPIHIIGVGIAPDDLSEPKLRMICNADVLVCGERLLKRFESFGGRRIVIKAPLEEIVHSIREEMESGKLVVVVAEGDPGFFGIGRKLIRAFERNQVVLIPNVTTLQAAASRMKIPWESVRTVSLHGRSDPRPLFRALASSDLVGVYTDKDSDPAALSGVLVARGVEGFRMWVFENLGDVEEKVGCYELEDAGSCIFSPLNFVILQRVRGPEIIPQFGMDDDLYLHSAGLITKKEIRAVGLAALRVEPPHIVWDLGAGCGSVSIEASLLAHEGAVYAVEKDESRVEMIFENRRRMGAYGVEVIRGTMPECLKNLPDPDRIFLGGGLGTGLGILEETLSRLKSGGRLVLHIVLLGSLGKVRMYLRSKRWNYSLTHVQVSRSRDLAGDERLESLNPVYILSIVKP